jgi:hypothetical protein
MRRISFKNCPYCGCNKIYASSSTTLWQKAAGLFLFRLVRCHVCMRRHYQPIFLTAPENPARTTTGSKAPQVWSIEEAEKKKRPA